jgi:hypothetical protein
MRLERRAAAALLTTMVVATTLACSNTAKSAAAGPRSQAVPSSRDASPTSEVAPRSGASPTSEVAPATAPAGGASIDVRAAYCPSGWTALRVTSLGATEVTGLGAVIACTDASRTTTYLENRSSAAWLLGPTVPAASVFRYHAPLGLPLFLQTVRSSRNREAVTPGSQLSIALPPTAVSWEVDLPLTYAWEGHSLIVGKLEAFGEGYTTTSLTPGSQAGRALAACTVGIEIRAAASGDLEDADPVETTLAGLGARAAGGACRTATDSVVLGDPAYTSLSDELDQVAVDPQLTTALTIRLEAASAVTRALSDDVRLLVGP